MRGIPATVVVLALLAVGCGSDDGGSGASSVDVGSGSTTAPSTTASPPAARLDQPLLTQYCDSWLELVAHDRDDDPQSDIEGSIELLAVILETGPSDLDFQALLEDYEEAAATISAVDWDPDQLDGPGADLVATVGESIYVAETSGPLAHAAFDLCDGAEDPSFFLPCVYARFEAVGEAIPGPDGELPVEPTVDLADAEDPDLEADVLLASTDGAVEYRSRSLDGGLVEYAFLDDEGVAVRLVELQVQGDGSWFLVYSNDCEEEG